MVAWDILPSFAALSPRRQKPEHPGDWTVFMGRGVARLGRFLRAAALLLDPEEPLG